MSLEQWNVTIVILPSFQNIYNKYIFAQSNTFVWSFISRVIHSKKLKKFNTIKRWNETNKIRFHMTMFFSRIIAKIYKLS